MDRSSNSHQAMWVALGQFSAFAIGIISPMILCRYFTKSDYGTYKQVMYVYHTLLIVFTLGLPKAYSYFIPRVGITQSKDIIRKISRIFLVLGALFSVLLFFGAAVIADMLHNPNLELGLKWFAPTPFLMLPVMGLEGILASYKRAKHIAIFTISTRLFTLLCTIFPVIFQDGSFVHAIIGFDIASVLTCILSFYLKYLPTRGIESQKTNVSYKEIFSFSLPLLTSSLWIMLFQSTNQFFVSRYYGNEVFAEFSNGFMEIPIIPMVVNSIATVLAPLFAGMAVNDKSSMIDVWNSALNKTIKVIYPISIYCIFFSGIVMTCLYGNQYSGSAIFFSIKNLEGFYSIIPFYPILMALSKTREYSYIHMIFAMVLIPIEFLIVSIDGPVYMIGVAFVLCSFGKVILQFRTVSKCLRTTIRRLLPLPNMIRVAFVSSLATFFPFLMANVLKELNEWLLLTITVSLFVICYYSLCWFAKISYRDVFGSILNKNPLIKKFIPN